MSNIHEADRGRPVRALATQVRCYGPDFPGWGHPEAVSFLRPITEGAPGTVTDVESHGSAPYARYAVDFGDGTHAGGLCLGDDIEFAGGNPHRRTRGSDTGGHGEHLLH
jgi:hypothetical protein